MGGCYGSLLERITTMKLIYSFLMIATFGLLVNNVSTSNHALLSKSELREVESRLQAIGNLK